MFEREDKRCFAKVVIYNNEMKLQWEFNDKMYGLNELNNIIIDECDLSIPRHRGSDFWMLENERVTLYDVGKRMRATEGQISLFDL